MKLYDNDGPTRGRIISEANFGMMPDLEGAAITVERFALDHLMTFHQVFAGDNKRRLFYYKNGLNWYCGMFK